MNPTLDPKQLETLMASDVFKQAQAAADAQRVKAHQTAVDALLVYEADTAAIDAARADAEKARRKFEPAQAAYLQALRTLTERESHLRDLTWGHEHRASIMANMAASHLPPIVAELDRAILYVLAEIRASFRARANHAPLVMGGSRTQIATNSEEIKAAVDFVQDIREGLAELAANPMSENAIKARLSDDCAHLCELAAEAGAMVRHLLPIALRGASPVEVPERTERRIYAIKS